MTAPLRRVRLQRYDTPTARQACRPWWKELLDILALALFLGSWWLIPNLYALLHER